MAREKSAEEAGNERKRRPRFADCPRIAGKRRRSSIERQPFKQCKTGYDDKKPYGPQHHVLPRLDSETSSGELALGAVLGVHVGGVLTSQIFVARVHAGV